MNNFVLSSVISLCILFFNGNCLFAQESPLKLFKSLELKIDYNQTYNLSIDKLLKKFKIRSATNLEVFSSQDLPSKKRGVCKVMIEIYEVTAPFMNAKEIAEEITHTGAELADVITTFELLKKINLSGNKLGFKKTGLIQKDFILIGLGSRFKTLDDDELSYHITWIPTLFQIKNTSFLELQEYEPSMYGGSPYFVAFRKIQ